MNPADPLPLAALVLSSWLSTLPTWGLDTQTMPTYTGALGLFFFFFFFQLTMGQKQHVFSRDYMLSFERLIFLGPMLCDLANPSLPWWAMAVCRTLAQAERNLGLSQGHGPS